ncbi:MAG: chromosomal replication initiator protein DnaA [Patescibacteria group bacterium]|nr:chromosomal replication initiator protein DnaA [Patescibacteria group bacterium]
MNTQEIWQSVLGELELLISKPNFITWFKNTGIINYQENEVLLCVPNNFTQAYLEKKYHQTIIKSLERITSKPIKKLEYKISNIKNLSIEIEKENTQKPDEQKELTIEINESENSQTYSVDQTPAYAPASTNARGLNPNYTFETFIVGPCSELAFAASQAVAAKPGVSYNPLFIYGGVGLGKTHLLHAIGNQILKNNPGTRILYVTTETFCNDFISLVRGGQAKEFQNRYRNVDLLLIDDIQFISGKDGTQESFFHTFNELHQQNKQIVLTSDRPPKAIPTLEDRLKSRFEWGMIADVGAPDLETRIAILKQKSEEKNFPLPSEILQNIAVIVQNNIRELEGALNKIIVYHQLKNIVPTVESVKSLLSNARATSMRSSLTTRKVIEEVSEFYEITSTEILSKSREKKICNPRQIIMFLMREELNMSFPDIGNELNNRDHTTALHAYKKINKSIEENLKLKQEIEMIKQRLYLNTVQ